MDKEAGLPCAMSGDEQKRVFLFDNEQTSQIVASTESGAALFATFRSAIEYV
jgi:hypothetical protein